MVQSMKISVYLSLLINNSTGRQMDRLTNPTDRQREGQTDREMDIKTVLKTNGQNEGETDTERWTNRQNEGETDREMDK